MAILTVHQMRALSIFLVKFCTRLNADSVVFLCSRYLISCNELDEVVELRSSAFPRGWQINLVVGVSRDNYVMPRARATINLRVTRVTQS